MRHTITFVLLINKKVLVNLINLCLAQFYLIVYFTPTPYLPPPRSSLHLPTLHISHFTSPPISGFPSVTNLISRVFSCSCMRGPLERGCRVSSNTNFLIHWCGKCHKNWKIYRTLEIYKYFQLFYWPLGLQLSLSTFLLWLLGKTQSFVLKVFMTVLCHHAETIISIKSNLKL